LTGSDFPTGDLNPDRSEISVMLEMVKYIGLLNGMSLFHVLGLIECFSQCSRSQWSKLEYYPFL
jgi:hypothetical protein